MRLCVLVLFIVGHIIGPVVHTNALNHLKIIVEIRKLPSYIAKTNFVRLKWKFKEKDV